jgi:hypothetical protein
MIAQFYRPNADQPNRVDRIQLTSRRINGGHRVYAKGYTHEHSTMVRNEKDFDTLAEVSEFFAAKTEEFLAAGFRHAYSF